jgi:hypothetical protein
MLATLCKAELAKTNERSVLQEPTVIGQLLERTPPRNKVLHHQRPKAPRHRLSTPSSPEYPPTKLLINFQQSCGV